MQISKKASKKVGEQPSELQDSIQARKWEASSQVVRTFNTEKQASKKSKPKGQASKNRRKQTHKAVTE